MQGKMFRKKIMQRGIQRKNMQKRRVFGLLVLLILPLKGPKIVILCLKKNQELLERCPGKGRRSICQKYFQKRGIAIFFTT